jgi:hypothetical protein
VRNSWSSLDRLPFVSVYSRDVRQEKPKSCERKMSVDSILVAGRGGNTKNTYPESVTGSAHRMIQFFLLFFGGGSSAATMACV